MFRSGFLSLAAALLTLLALAPGPASAGGMKPAEKMCDALGGKLDGGMIEADGAGYGNYDATTRLKSGRGDEYRRRVASDQVQSHLATSAH